MKSMYIRLWYVCGIALLLLGVQVPVAWGQMNLPVSSSGQNLQFTLNPRIPGPNETVNVSVVSYAHELDRTYIRWYVNDQLFLEGIGKKNINITTGSLGSVTKVRVSAATEGGATFGGQMSIRPVHLDITWEADTYVPPFYKGKALHSASTFVKFVAIPTFVDAQGAVIPPDELVYTWKMGARKLVDQSGFGEYVLVLKNEKFIAPFEINLEVTDFDNTQMAKREISVKVDQPEIVFYADHPLLGVQYYSAIPSTFSLENEEITILAEPFFFTGSKRSDFALERSWRLDRAPIEGGESLTLRPVGNVEGVSLVELTLRHTINILQSARGEFRVSYKNTETEESALDTPTQ